VTLCVERVLSIQEIITDSAIRAPYAISAKTGYGIRKLKTIVSQQITIKSQKKSVKFLTNGNAVFKLINIIIEL
jgi:hypothetical protein